MKKCCFSILTVLFTYLPFLNHNLSIAQALEQDSLALIALYDSTDGANWTNNENWLTTEPVSNWYGIVTKDGRVTEIELFNNSLVGTIPNEINALDSLTRLSVGRNQLSGEIPAQIFELTELIYLFIDHNEFEGEIPSLFSNLTKLEKLNLGKNQLTGEIPNEIYGLTKLTYFEVYSNQLYGEVPSEIGNLINLHTLSLSHNDFHGEILNYILNMPNLRMVFLQNNQFTGSIPIEIGNLTNLYWLNMAGNQFIGSIPSVIENLTKLALLHLADNHFSGIIPTEIGNLLELESLYLNGNSLAGTIPIELGKLKKLENLILYSNQLTGIIPVELSTIDSLKHLNLYDNQLSGFIPNELGNLGNLYKLVLAENQFEGSVPGELNNLLKLEELYLQGNQLSELPDFSPLTLLARLRIQDNNFTFEDVEPNVWVPTFTCSPQAFIGMMLDTTISAGESITLSVDVGGTANVYKWSKDGLTIDDATEFSYLVDSAEASDAGIYTCAISNTIVSDLILYSNNMKVTVDGAVDVEDYESEIPTKFALFQNYPNPFNPTTTIKYSIPALSVISNPQRGERSSDQNNSEISPFGRNENVKLSIYDILGREVKNLINAKQKPGNYEVVWNAEEVPSGVYFYQIRAAKFVETKKMILLR